MATLYGTTADGESLPVQVNEFGQLVAQGLPGEQGIQGPPGPEGPVGSVELTTGTFLPEFKSSDASGAGFMTYSNQSGYWARFGPLLTVWINVKTSECALTNIRGDLIVGGIPPEASFALPAQSLSYGPCSISAARFENIDTPAPIIAQWFTPHQGFRLSTVYGSDITKIQYADLTGDFGNVNQIRMTFNGLAADAVRSVPIELDELM